MLSTLEPEIKRMPNINYNRPLGSCQQGERLFPLRRIHCSPFKSRKFETANRAYENENHKAAISSQDSKGSTQYLLGGESRLHGAPAGGWRPLKPRRRPSAIHPSARRRRHWPPVGSGKCLSSCKLSECVSGKHTLGQKPLEQLCSHASASWRPWEESAIHRSSLGPTPFQSTSSGISDRAGIKMLPEDPFIIPARLLGHAADVRFGSAMIHICGSTN